MPIGDLDAIATREEDAVDQTITALLASPEAWAALATLIAMEVILGIDNLLFISILTNKVAENRRKLARRIGLGLAMAMRLALLAGVAWIMELTRPVFTVLEHSFSWKDMILVAGGFFLVFKATREIHHYVEPETEGGTTGGGVQLGLAAAIGQIVLLDAVFSVDSIITAIGMTPHIEIIVVAIVIAVATMLVAADPLAEFVDANPTILMLALGFLLMIGMVLIAEGFGVHVPKGYVYTAMAFSALVETMNILKRRRRAREKAAG